MGPSDFPESIAHRLAEAPGSWPPESLPMVAASPGYVYINNRKMIALSSNDYLGLACDDRVVSAARDALDEYGLGARAARTLGGDTYIHRDLEAALADFKSTESVLLFGSGYACNQGVISALMGPGDRIFSDELNHASLIDGARLSNAKISVYSHCDIASLKTLLEAEDAPGGALIVTDTVFSMDGDLAPIDEMILLAETSGAGVLLDDAHATGVIGPSGKGAVGHFTNATRAHVITGTLGKALGSVGAFVAGSEALINYLAYTARPFLMSTAIPPAAAAGALRALHILQEEPDLVTRLWANAKQLHTALRDMSFDVRETHSPIIRVMIGDTQRTIKAARRLFEHGVVVHAVTPPFVKEGSARLRIINCAAHNESDISRTIDAFSMVRSDLDAPSYNPPT